MCWNETVSLNTFIFSISVLLLIMYNNAFTQYKIQYLNNRWIYLFFASFIFMQLIECFIWRNINNKFYNHLFSIMATVLLIIQPVISILIVSNTHIRNILLTAYLLLAIPYSIYKFCTKNIYSVISEKGHLRWKFFELTPVIMIIWLFFFLFSFIYEKQWIGFWFGFVTLAISYYNYNKDHTMPSMWCWVVNVGMLYYAFYLLLYLPFCERGSIC